MSSCFRPTLADFPDVGSGWSARVAHVCSDEVQASLFVTTQPGRACGFAHTTNMLSPTTGPVTSAPSSRAKRASASPTCASSLSSGRMISRTPRTFLPANLCACDWGWVLWQSTHCGGTHDACLGVAATIYCPSITVNSCTVSCPLLARRRKPPARSNSTARRALGSPGKRKVAILPHLDACLARLESNARPTSCRNVCRDAERHEIRRRWDRLVDWITRLFHALDDAAVLLVGFLQ